MVQHRCADRLALGRGDGLNHQHPARGVRIVAEDVHQHIAAAGQQGGVADGDRGAVAVAGNDVHAYQLLCAGRAVGHEVGHIVCALGSGVEGEGLLVRSHGGSGVSVGSDLGEPERSALRVRIVLQRRHNRVHAGDGDNVVCVGDRRKRSRGAHVYGDFVFGSGLAVGDRHGDYFAAGLGAGVLETEQAVRPGLDLVAGVAAAGTDHVKVVAVRVDPVGQDVLADELAGLHYEGGVPVRLPAGGRVLPRRNDVEGDIGGGAEAAAVVYSVFELLGAGLVRRYADLETGGTVDRG
ncbi:hypothetical protein D9M72_381470 [compost metagenome]